MRQLTWLGLGALCWGCLAGLEAAEYWSWEVGNGTTLGNLPLEAVDGDALVYRENQISPGNYRDIVQLDIQGKQELTFSAEYRIPVALQQGYFALRAIFFNAAGDVVGASTSRLRSQAEGWQELRCIFAAPADATSALLRFVNTAADPVWVRRAQLIDATAEDQEKIGRFAGTREEKIVLHSQGIGGNPQPIFVLDYENYAPDDRYSVKLVWDHDEEGFGLVDIGCPMEVPPTGERRLERVEFYLNVTRNTGDLKLIPMVTVADVNLSSDNVNFGQLDFTDEVPPTGEWRKFSYEIPADRQISGGSFLLRLHGRGETTFRLGLPKFYYSDGSVATGFSVWQDPLWLFPDWSERPFQSKFTSTDGMVICDTLQATQAGPSGREALLELKRRIPNLGNIMIYNITEGLKERQWYEDHDIAMVYQNVPNGLWQLAMGLDENVLSYRPDSYAGLETDLHKFNAAHPAWREVFSQFAERLKDYGMPELMSIDCIFQFSGDDAQYAPWYVEFLLERDEGFELKDAPERLRFSDYFANYTGFSPTPEFFGWTSWNEYEPIPFSRLWQAGGGASTELRRRGLLDTMLRHYAFMMYNTRLGEELGKRGIAYFLMNNGDNWQNGNDWQINARSTAVPGFVEETFFYHPSCVYHSVTDAMAFRDFYAHYQTRHRLIQETAQGGHGNPYWDVFNTFALVSAMNAATDYASMQVDWPFESSMQTLRGQGNEYTTPRFNSFVTMAAAFNTQKAIGNGEVPEATRRTILLHENAANVAYLSAPRLSNVLTEGPWYGSNASFNLWDLPYVNDAKVLYNDYYALPVGGAEKLLQWLNAAPGRALVLNGYTAGKIIDGTYWGSAFGWDMKRLNQPEQFVDVIGAILPENGLYRAEKEPDEVLLSDESGAALLSVYQRAGERKIYYYSGVPGEDPARDAQVVELIQSREFSAPTYRKSRGDTRLFAYEYADGGNLFCLFSQEAMAAFQMNPSVPVKGKFTFEQPAVDNLVTVKATPGAYDLYAFLKDEVRPVEVAASGELELPLRGQATELYYLVPRTGAKISVEELQKMRRDWQSQLKH